MNKAYDSSKADEARKLFEYYAFFMVMPAMYGPKLPFQMHKRQDPRLFELYFSESVVDEWVVSDLIL